MAVGAVDTATIAMQPEIEGRTMLYDGFVETRKHNMGLIAHAFDRNHQKAMLFAGIAARQRGAVVGSGLIRAEHFLRQRLVQVYE